MNSCYEFMAFNHPADHLVLKGQTAYDSPIVQAKKWKVIKGLDGSANSITLQSPYAAHKGMCVAQKGTEGHAIIPKTLADQKAVTFYISKT